MFSDFNYSPPKLSNYSDSFYLLLEEIQKTKPNLIKADLDVREEYGLSRSLRRGATTRAVVVGVDSTVIELNNRWRRVEAARGKLAGLSIRQHYTEIRQTVSKQIEFSMKL